MVRLLGLRVQSEVAVEKLWTEEAGEEFTVRKLSAEEVHKMVVTYDRPRFHVLVKKMESEDVLTKDRAERSWDAFNKILETEAE